MIGPAGMDDGEERFDTSAPLTVVTGGQDGWPPVPAAPRLVLPTDWLPVVLLGGDALIAAASVCAAYWLRTVDYADPASRLQQFGPYFDRIPLVLVLSGCALALNGQYRSWRGSRLVEQLFRLSSGIGLAMLLILALGALTHTIDGYSRYAMTYAAILSAVAMASERVLLRGLETRLRRRGIGTERVLLVGASEAAEVLIGRLAMFPELGYTVCGVVDDFMEAGSSFAGRRVLGRTGDLARLVSDLAVDTCILALPSDRRDDLADLVRRCTEQRIDFRLVPDLLELTSTRASAESVDGLPLVGVRRGRIGSPAWAGKRLIDLAVASAALVLSSPLLLGIAAGIRLAGGGGPVLSRQVRIGRFGRPFTAFQFRTAPPPGESRVVALRGARTTAFGRLLRRTALHELPLLVNVVRGDMSLVGPRPQPVPLDDRYRLEVPRYLERHQVRPGLVGWAEANDAARVADRTRYDVYYVENWSLAMDLRVVVLTALRLVRDRQAN
jgi:exopolysaccharide biosynthesis polyprenyl glycosylphosphotransferase